MQEGLVNTAWGSHVYYTSVSVYDQQARPSSFPRPMTLTKFAPPDWYVQLSNIYQFIVLIVLV